MPNRAPISFRVSLVRAISWSSCWNRSLTAPKYFSASSLGAQRGRIEAAAALISSGDPRNTKRTFPVSIYFDLNIGNTFSPNAAQWGQLIDAYSGIITGAFAERSAMAGSDTGFATRG